MFFAGEKKKKMNFALFHTIIKADQVEKTDRPWEIMSYRGFGLENVGPGGPKKHFSEMTQEEQAEEGAKQMIEFMVSCPGKSIMSGVTGFGLGGVFGLFMASVSME